MRNGAYNLAYVRSRIDNNKTVPNWYTQVKQYRENDFLRKNRISGYVKYFG